MNERSHNRNPRGFTLIELLIATLLISIFLLPLLTVLHREMISSNRTRIFNLALVIAQEEMEEVLDLSLSEKDLNDRSRKVRLMNYTFNVERDVLDGEGNGEPYGGTDPLEVRVRVYHGEERVPMIRLVTLKEDW